jgi:hypothetical protein
VRRVWLYLPYGVLAVAAIAWSLAWLAIRAEVAARMDAAAERLRLAGYTVDWKTRRIDGYPFRIDVTLDGLRLAERSGWALTAPQVRTEAYAYRLDQWIGYAPSGVVLNRPLSGAVAITGQALRASYGGAGADAPRIAVEGVKLVFTPAQGAKPFLIQSADHLDFHTHAVGDDRSEFLLRVDGAAAPTAGLLATIAQAKPVNIAWQARLTHASSLRGQDWPQTVQAWTAAGGALEVEHGVLNAGATAINLRPGRLDVGWDGRLRGTLGLDLRQALSLIRILADAKTIDPGAADQAFSVAQARAAGGPLTQADLTFLAGATAFGPVAIGPAPKVY